MYGYEMIKALEEKSGGFYAPSAGSVYPTLQMLEEGGFVTSSQVEGKKVYSITESGRTFLNERQKENDEFTGPAWGRGFGGRRPFAEMQALRSEAMEVARLFAIAGRMSFNDAERLTRLRGIIERTRKDLSDMIYGSQTQSV
jgi:DNA-binding PadR family transcriptional regulator